MTEDKTSKDDQIAGFHRYSRMLIGILLLFAFFSAYWLWLDYRNFVKQPINFPEEHRVITIEKGMGINRLANQLYQNEIIKSPIYLKLLAHLKPEYKNIKVGEYQLGETMKPDQLLSQLSKGVVIQYAFTIVEGQNIHEILNNLANDSRLIPLEEFSDQQLLLKLGIESPSIEGWLFPETYYFSKGDSALSILLRAKESMESVLAEEWHDRSTNLPYDSPYQALIMASIIEKETGIAEERDEIAGVFVRRLRKNMRLQTDPTVIYGIGPEFNGDITRRDLKTPTAYNTYVIKGLPPTPIAMPSQASIYAALHPAAGNTLYFVADGSGGHYFSETLEEHQLAVRRMLKRLRENK